MRTNDLTLRVAEQEFSNGFNFEAAPVSNTALVADCQGAFARCSTFARIVEGGPQLRATMASILITRDQFNITPQGITHKPTEASFTPHCGDPLSGSVHLGQLESQAPNGDHYDADVVKEIMTQLWSEYVAANSDLFYEEERPVAGRLADTRS